MKTDSNIFYHFKLFCCGVRRHRRRRKYETEHPQVLYVVHVDRNGPAASGGTKEKELKDSTAGKDIKKAEEDDGKNEKEDGGKDGCKNGGYESDHKDKVNKLVVIIIILYQPPGEHRASNAFINPQGSIGRPTVPSNAHGSLSTLWLSPRSKPLFPTPSAFFGSASSTRIIICLSHSLLQLTFTTKK